MNLDLDTKNRNKLGRVTYEIFRERQEAVVYQDECGYVVTKIEDRRRKKHVREGSYEYTLIEAALHGHSNVKAEKRKKDEDELERIWKQLKG